MYYTLAAHKKNRAVRHGEVAVGSGSHGRECHFGSQSGETLALFLL